MDKLFSVIASPLPFIIVISVVITIHELGHYWVGRRFGAAVESFSLGFGRPIFQRTDKNGTRWRLNWLPLGGFVKFVGEAQLPQDVGKVEKGPIGKLYTDLNPWQRLAISLGGPAMNFIFAIFVFGAVSMLGTFEVDGVRVGAVTPGGAAEKAGFQKGDLLLKAGDREVKSTRDILMVTRFSRNEAVPYRVERDGRVVELVATPTESADANPDPGAPRTSAKIGIALEPVNPHVRHRNPLEAVQYGVTEVGDTIGTTIWVISKLRIDSFSGPLGVLTVADGVTDQTMKQAEAPLWDRLMATAVNLFFLAGLLSVGVGFFNLLPVPVLDGGYAVMFLAEGLTGKQIPEKVQRIGLTIGLACIVTFAVVVTWNDLLKIRLG